MVSPGSTYTPKRDPQQSHGKEKVPTGHGKPKNSERDNVTPYHNFLGFDEGLNFLNRHIGCDGELGHATAGRGGNSLLHQDMISCD
jgi:hypothetical protein